MSEPSQQPQAYDRIVLGSGPAGSKAVLAAAKQRCRVAIIDERQAGGGACLHTGTMPRKTLREAVRYWTGDGLHSIDGGAYRPTQHLTREDWTFRIQHVIRRALEVLRDQMQRNGRDRDDGAAHFVSPSTLEVASGPIITSLTGEPCVIAVGSVPVHPAHRPPRRAQTRATVGGE